VTSCAKNPSLLLALAIALGAAGVGAISSPWVGTTAVAEDKPAVGPLRHVVLVKFKEDATKEQVAEVVRAFGAMQHKIDAIAGFEWGTDVSVENLAQGFTHCFIVTFKDAKARDEYLPHPVHEEFKKVAIPRIDKVLVVDFHSQK
jgi:hypothetical protein